ncbi:MAG: secondary thiamine-phosphate synthase enzyme YjbQ [Crocinitomicaceae bacterium]
MKQVILRLKEYPRGVHLITDEILVYLPDLPKTGLLHLFIQHTSAGICINENADPTARIDLNNWLDKNIKENEPYYRHTFEGPDDMPAHIKAMLMGTALTIPITEHQLNLGTWQGIYLGEFRNHGGRRKIIATINGYSA